VKVLATIALGAAGLGLVLAACGGGDGGGSEKASPTTAASAKPTAPGQLDVTFGDPVPYTPTEQLEDMFNENQNPVAVDVTVTNHGKQEHPGLGFWLITSDGSDWYGISLDPDVVAKFPPGNTKQGPVIFGPLKTSGPPIRVEARELGGQPVAGRDL
jgi:hypothetical protein